jgi:cytochrome P450
MLPSIIANFHNLHDAITLVLAAHGKSFEVHGPSVSSMRFFLTCDPPNVRHIFTKNFANFPKGDDFAGVFSILDGTIFTADGESWRQQRARIQQIPTRPQLVDFVARCCHEKVAEGLVPLLSRMASKQTPFDMEDLLGRLVLDITIKVVFGTDPCHLSAEMGPMHVATALDTVMEVALYRHCVPVSCWKVMRRFNVGWERKLAAAEAVLNSYVADRIHMRMMASHGEVTTLDILSYYINDPDYFDHIGEPTEFLHKTFINYIVALRDPMGAALPWLVFHLATNPQSMYGLRNELAPIAAGKSATAVSSGRMVIFEPGDIKDHPYSRAALFESLRLFPPGPIERKMALADDVMPSGHKVRGGDTVLVSVYSMGRLEDVWGQDCQVYKPERWLSEDGTQLRCLT